MKSAACALILSLFLCVRVPAEETFISDPRNPELRSLAKPLVIDESKYGCGPMLKPGRTYYVSLKGDDKNDGLSWQSAWRRLGYAAGRLKAGDTLLIGEGEYEQGWMALNVKGKRAWTREVKEAHAQVGEPGRPIRIMAAPRQRVIIVGAEKIGPLRRTAGTRHVYEAPLKPPRDPMVWEARSMIMLQNAGTLARVEELPATFCVDAKNRKIHVRFADPGNREGEFIYVRPTYHPGLRIHGSYIHVKGLWFKHCDIGLIMRANLDKRTREYDPKCGVPRGGEHNTIEECAFFANGACGLNLTMGARWNLIKDNYGCKNEPRGTIMFQGAKTSDNLFIGNLGDPSPDTVRTRTSNLHYAINTYGGVGARNHIINNALNDTASFRWKPANRQTVFQGNRALGTVYCTGTATRWSRFTEADRMILRSNVILGRVSWNREGFGPGGPGGDWAGKGKVFINNFHANRDPKAVAAARFADPAWLDFRLQSDSPLKGKALGGGDRGAYPRPVTRVFYVGPEGADKSAGTSERSAFSTFARATAALRPGDALYVMKGKRDEPLALTASGAPGRPIHVRAYRKERVALPGIVVRGSHVTVQGFDVVGAKGDGIQVTGDHVRVERCVAQDVSGAGIRARGAKELTLNHCTFTAADTGVALEKGTTNATVRNCVLAHNRRAPLRTDDSSRPGYRGYSNVYFGVGLDRKRIASEPDSIVADPLFVDASTGDCRLKADSPAKYLAEFGRAAGAAPVLNREPMIADVRVTADQPNAVVIEWTTPLDDTRGGVQYRRKGRKKWNVVNLPGQGTVHAAAVTYRVGPKATYEFRVSAHGRRGGQSLTEVATFSAPVKARPSATFHVAPDGGDTADGRSRKTAWRSLRKASLAVRPGDTVLVAPGVYHNTIRPVMGGRPGRRITFRSPTPGAALIDGAGALEYLVFLQHKNYVTIDGFRLDCGPTKLVGSPRLIQINSCRGVEILNCRAATHRLGAQHAIGGGSCRGLRIEGNCIWGTRYHIRMGKCSDMLVKNNTFVRYSVYSASLGSRFKNLRIVNNIFAHPKATRNTYLHFRMKKHGGIVCDYNLYAPFENPKCNVGRYEDVSTGILKLKFPPARLKRWQAKTGFDRHSLYADPMFVDPDKGDFRLKPDSPAIRAGEGGANIGALGVAQ